MSRFEENPMFWPELDRALGNSLEEMTADIRDTAKSNTSSRGYARDITAKPIKHDASGPYGEVTTGGGIGNVLEGGTKNRRTKRGANRGSTDAERAIERARDSEVPKGLDLSRYL